ncbi:MAG TPA: serine/threonine-protein kinase [Thermoanaerobaculia bacterium]|nr:serine/threonine-protein kinase [Thermoanaerobaculia bacterium]
MLGRRIGSWTLVRELGHGGMGAVFEARHVSLSTQAAVKVLSAGLESREAFRQRFRREAEMQAQLRHPNVARVLDYVEDGGQWFLVIEYLDRGSLADYLARGEKVSREQAIAWMRDALAGLGHAHEKGIVHRDVKPANLMFGARGEVVVMDFGIARTDTAPGLTATGITIGTPQYMSPEQIMTPNQLDGRADIYSLGIVLYELLAGRRPFEARSEFSVLQAHVSEPPPPLHSIDPTIPRELEAVVMRALAKSPEERFPDCAAMIRALDLVVGAGTAESVAAAAGGTVQQSVLYPRANVQNLAGPSPGEVRDRKRRAFQMRLVAGVVTFLVVATLLAAQFAGKTEVISIPPPGTETTQTTDTTPTTATNNTAGSTFEDEKPSRPVKPVKENLGATMLVPNVTQTTPDPLTERRAEARPTLPPVPQIAVIGTGDDPMLAASLEQEMERRLDAYRVSDERGDPDVDELLGRGNANAKTFGAQLLKSGFHVLILLRVEKGDQRTFHFRGQEGSIKGARIRLSAYLLPANRSLGPGWTELVEYTELSASAKARQAFIGATADLRQAIDDEWAQLRGGQP